MFCPFYVSLEINPPFLQWFCNDPDNFFRSANVGLYHSIAALKRDKKPCGTLYIKLVAEPLQIGLMQEVENGVTPSSKSMLTKPLPQVSHI